MRIAIVNLTAGLLSSGYRKYLQSLLPILESDPSVDEISVYVPGASKELFDEPRFLSWPSTDTLSGFRWLRWQISSSEADVIFIPAAGYLGGCGIPVVNMIRNMEPLTRPFSGNSLGMAARHLARRWIARRNVRKADRVVAVSGFVRDFLLKEWRLSHEKLAVIYHGVDIPDATSIATPERLTHLGLEGTRFAFSAGCVMPYRGLEDIVEAAVELEPQQYQKVLIAGPVYPWSRGYFERIQELTRARRLQERVVFVGELNRREMEWCYFNSSAFIMTSRVEACPNVALEALAHGCLCVSTDSQPMPEFFGEAARYYRAGDHKQLVNQLNQHGRLGDADRGVWRSRAIRRAEFFSWRKTASETLKQLALARERFASRFRAGERSERVA